MLSRSAKSFLTVLALFASIFFGNAPSNASTLPFAANLDLHLANLVTPGTTFEFSEGRACFPLVGSNAPYKTLYFNEVLLTYRIDLVEYTDSLDYSADRVGDTYKACASPTGLGFERATDIALSGLVHTNSSFANNFSAYMSSKKISVTDIWFLFEGGRSTPQLTLSNDTAKPLSFSISNLLIDGQAPANAPKYLMLPAKSTGYLALGSIAGNYQQDHLAVPAEITLSPVRLSSLIPKGLKVAKGLKILPNAVASWGFPSTNDVQPDADLTLPCLQVKNTTKKPMTIKAALTWKLGSEKLVGTDGNVLTIEAGQTICLGGLDSNDRYFEGDVRVGRKLNVSGQLKTVKATTFDTTGIVLNGHALSWKPGILYDSTTKTTTIYLHVAKVSSESNSILSNGTVNGLPLAAVAVGGGCECGGGDILPGTRTIKIEKIKGDQRIGKKLTITGSLATSPEVSVQGIESLMSQDNSYGCFLYHPEQEIQYNPLTNTTDFSVFCYNHTIQVHNINLNGITASTDEAGKPNQVYSLLPNANLISLRPAQAWTKRTLFRLIGDWRTGAKTLNIIGVPVFQ